MEEQKIAHSNQQEEVKMVQRIPITEVNLENEEYKGGASNTIHAPTIPTRSNTNFIYAPELNCLDGGHENKNGDNKENYSNPRCRLAFVQEKRSRSRDKSTVMTKNREMLPVGTFQCLLLSHADKYVLYQIEIDSSGQYINLIKDKQRHTSSSEPIQYELAST